MMRIRAGVGLVLGLVSLGGTAVSARATSGSAVPLAGDWEGAGPHGLPLSFQLVRRGGQLIATSIALGSPSSCPAESRDAIAVALSHVAYAGPGGRLSSGFLPSSPPAILSGQLPAPSGSVFLTGSFTSPRAGTFSVRSNNTVGCGWPNQTLTWTVHPARPLHVPDGTWAATLTGPGIVSGAVKAVVASDGRVVNSFVSSFTCENAQVQADNNFIAAPAYEFIRPDGTFSSPELGGTVKGDPVTWAGRLSPAHGLTGTLNIYDACTKRVVRAQFRTRKRAP
jgi:hypothetical protein